MRFADGGQIDRTRPLTFTFNGRRYQGFAGDTLASALLANDVKLVGRSFKFHRARGVLSAGLEEPNALVTVGEGAHREVSVRATEVPLRDGLVAASQNCWPFVWFDLGAIARWFAALLPAGFYHKTFKWPSWRWYEKPIRHAAGLGRIGHEADPDRYAKRFHHCDVLVVGAGAAGIAAAAAAARDGAEVTIVDTDSVGGAVSPDGRGQRPLLQLSQTTAVGYYEDNLVVAVEKRPSTGSGRTDVVSRLWKIRAGEVILATGATERPLVFQKNDLPGIMLASAVHTYATRFAAVPGREVLVFTNNDSAYRVAVDLHALGVAVVGIVDVRRDPKSELVQRVRDAAIPVYLSSVVSYARGHHGVRGVEVTLPGGASKWIACDLLAMSGGWNPNLQLYAQAGGQLRYDDAIAAFVPRNCPQKVRCVGAAAGELDFATEACWRVPGDARRQWVDFQYDVTVADLELAVREGFSSIELLKRYTSVGMAPDQGRTSNVNALAILSGLTSRSILQVGATTARPPLHPVTIGALAGARVDALAQRYRRLPVRWHEENAGVMEDHSGWLRAACYPRSGESERNAITREARAARTHASLFDSSSLGKIEVFGPDAAEFLNRLYVNNVRTLKPGRMRYGMMLTDNGIIKDDGVFACIAPDHYLVCTSSAGARDIHFWMEEWRQCEWRELDVQIVPQTAQWATLTVAGPQARAIVSRLKLGIDLSAPAFPHMQFREAVLDGAAVRVRRASYTGEASFELDIAAEHADRLWRRLLELGAADGVTPLGMEALDVLRVEKGFLEVGVDTDAETTPLDVGWGEAIAKKPDDFIGRRSLLRPAQQAPDRLQLVGLLTEDPQQLLPVGAHALDERGDVIGHVTSSCGSPNLQRTLAMGRVRGGARRLGEIISVDVNGSVHRVRIGERAFYDPKGERLGA
jgi:sarcosine oxidase, subunit alpha